MTAPEDAIQRPARSLFRSASLVTGLALFRGLLAFGASIAVTRALGPTGRGKVAFVVTAAGLLSWAVSFGMGPALTRAKATGQETIAQLYAASIGISLLTGAAMSVLWALAFVAARGSLFSGVTTSDAWWVTFLIPVLVLINNLGHVASLEGRVVAFNGWLAAAAAGFLVAVAALAVTSRLTPSNAVGLFAATSAVPLLLFRGAYRHRTGFGLARVRRFLSGSVRSNLASLAMFGMWRIDVLFVKAERGYRELGYYAVAVSIAEVLLLLAVSVRASLQVVQGRSEERGRLPSLIARATRLTALLSVVAGVAMCAGGSLLIRVLYGRALEPAFPALALLVPGVVALALHGPLFDYLYSEGRANGVVVAMGLALVLNVVLNVVLLRTHSFLAAAFASTVAYGFVLAACAVQFCRTTGCSVAALLVPRRDDLRLRRLR